MKRDSPPSARFAILRHDHPWVHWDFLLEAGDVCRTWRLEEEPRAGQPIASEAIADHRLHYLSYEGPVSGNRGNVSQWDAGTFWGHIEEETFSVRLAGGRFRGTCEMTRMNGRAWQAFFLIEG